jgi:hypothetical protein
VKGFIPLFALAFTPSRNGVTYEYLTMNSQKNGVVDDLFRLYIDCLKMYYIKEEALTILSGSLISNEQSNCILP